MHSQEIKKISFCGILIGLIIVLTITNIGFIIFPGGISATIIHIPVMIGAIILGKKYGLVLGATFGIVSLIMAFINIATNAPFTNPIVSVLPRMFFGFIISPLYELLKRKINNKTISTVLTMVIGTIIHTAIVITLLYIIWSTGFYFGVEDFPANDSVNLFTIILGILTLNSLLEIGLAAVIGTPLAIVLNDVVNNNNNN